MATVETNVLRMFLLLGVPKLSEYFLRFPMFSLDGKILNCFLYFLHISPCSHEVWLPVDVLVLCSLWVCQKWLPADVLIFLYFSVSTKKGCLSMCYFLYFSMFLLKMVARRCASFCCSPCLCQRWLLVDVLFLIFLNISVKMVARRHADFCNSHCFRQMW